MRDAAFVAIRNAMEFSQHVFDLEQSRELGLDGFRSFCELQAEFMEALYRTARNRRPDLKESVEF